MLNDVNEEWKEFCKKTYAEWKKTQPKIPRYINNPDWEFDAIEELQSKWKKHIHKLGDEWWGSRNYDIEWPKFSNEPLKVHERKI